MLLKKLPNLALFKFKNGPEKGRIYQKQFWTLKKGKWKPKMIRRPFKKKAVPHIVVAKKDGRQWIAAGGTTYDSMCSREVVLIAKFSRQIVDPRNRKPKK